MKLPQLLSKYSVIVVSPLYALMMHQIQANSNGVKCQRAEILRATGHECDGVSSTISPVYDYCKCTEPGQIIFAHPKALIEDEYVFKNFSNQKHTNIASKPSLLTKHIWLKNGKGKVPDHRGPDSLTAL